MSAIRMTSDELKFVGTGGAVHASIRAPAGGGIMSEDVDGGPVTVSNAAIKDNIVQVSTSSTLATSVQTVVADSVADSSAGAITLTIPAASAVSGTRILDAGGVAGTNNITVAAAGTDTIHGQTTLGMNSNHAAVDLCAYFTGAVGKWFAPFLAVQPRCPRL